LEEIRHTLFPTTLGILRLWGLRITLGYILAFTLGLGSLGIWLPIAISNLIGGLIAILWIKHGNKSSHKRENNKGRLRTKVLSS